MMTAHWLNIPPPPSVNALFANVAGEGRVRSARYKQWATAAGWRLQSQKSNWPSIAPGQAYLTGRYQDMNDFAPMCRSCHWKHDSKIFNIKHMRRDADDQA